MFLMQESLWSWSYGSFKFNDILTNQALLFNKNVDIKFSAHDTFLE
jgi:hypothetical protein